MFHDINVRDQDEFGVWKLWEEIGSDYPRRHGFSHCNGLGVIRKPGGDLDALPGALATLLGQGEEPYEPDEADTGQGESAGNEAVEPSGGPGVDSDRSAASDDDAVCPITPASILEAMLFVGHPGNEPLTSGEVAGLMRGVRPSELSGPVADQAGMMSSAQ